MGVRRLTIFLLLLLFITVLLFLLFNSKKVQSCNNCNVIIISIDTLRQDSLGVYGYSKNTTPNIDKWAEEAMIFSNARTVAPITLPSLFALMTGRNPLEVGVYNNNPLDFHFGKQSTDIFGINHRSLAETLKSNGYTTTAFVTNAILDPKISPINKGFDNFNFLNDDPNAQEQGKATYQSFVRNVLPWLSENHNKKFFLWLHLIDPHAPYTPPIGSLCTMHDSLCKEQTNEKIADHEIERKGWEGCKDVNIPMEKLNLFRTLYDSEISLTDKLVGEIFDKTKSLNLDQNTIVILYGDHGEGFDHRYYFHHSEVLYDSSLKIPFVIKIPNSKKVLNTDLIDNTQIFNSLLSILGISKASDENIFQTKILGLNNPSKDYIYASSGDLTKYSIQSKKYKYIYSLPESSCLNNNQTEELYDLSSDPFEEKNIFYEMPSVATLLKKELFNHFRIYGLPRLMNDRNKKNVDEAKQKIIEILNSAGY